MSRELAKRRRAYERGENEWTNERMNDRCTNELTMGERACERTNERTRAPDRTALTTARARAGPAVRLANGIDLTWSDDSFLSMPGSTMAAAFESDLILQPGRPDSEQMAAAELAVSLSASGARFEPLLAATSSLRKSESAAGRR